MITEPEPANITNRSGGNDLTAQGDINVGGDDVGRDKIYKIYIEHATIIQSGLSVQEIRPTAPTSTNNNRRIGGLEFVCIPAGKFIMGSEHNDWEKPQHTVEIPYDYWISRYEVTNNDFAEFVQTTSYVTVAEREGGRTNDTTEELSDWRHPCGLNSTPQSIGNHPVVYVTWYDAKAYCKWLNAVVQKEFPLAGSEVRLPSEARVGKSCPRRIWQRMAVGQ